MGGRDGDVVEQAEAHRPLALGVMSRRPQAAERRRGVAGSRRSAAHAAPPAACSAAAQEPVLATVSSVDHARRRPRSAPRSRRRARANGPAAAAGGSPPAPRRDRGRASRPPRARPRSRQPRRVLGVRPGVVLERRGMSDVQGHGGSNARRVGPSGPQRRCAATVPGASVRRHVRWPPPSRQASATSPWWAAGRRACSRAIRAAEAGARTVLVSRKPLAESSAIGRRVAWPRRSRADDSPARHADDTLNAGRGACRTAAVEVLGRGGARGGR